MRNASPRSPKRIPRATFRARAHWTGFTARGRSAWSSGMDRPNRLHDRRLFSRDVKGWHSSLLFP